MPFKSIKVKPEVLLRHKGVIVYCTYENGDLDNCNSEHFTVFRDHTDDDDSSEQFDVRELSTFVSTHPPEFLSGKGDNPANKRAWAKWEKQGGWDKDRRDALIRAINLKILTRKGVFEPKPEIPTTEHTALPWVFEDEFIRAHALDDADYGNVVLDPGASGYQAAGLPSAVKKLNAQLTVRAVNNHQLLINAGKALLQNIHASNKDQFAVALANAIEKAERRADENA